MKRFGKILFLISFILLLSLGCKEDKKENIKQEISKRGVKDIPKVEKSSEIDRQIKSMTLNEKMGQLFVVGFEGKDIDEDTKNLIQDLKIGGLIFFGRNIEDANQTRELISSLKKLNKINKIPLFISIDEEGGKVSRLPKEFNKLPEAVDIGDANSQDLSFEYGKLLGLRLNSLGFNTNYAPVMDINSNPRNPVIGNRAFGNSPEVVSKNGVQVMKGMKSQGIIPVIKHFPGHGDTDVDSHIGLPVVNKSIEDIRKFELTPFKKSIEEGADMIMVAHIIFPEIDREYPSTMSKEVIEDILRGELGFEGVVISDDLTMGAITKNYSLEEATLKFFQSGGDIALICHGVDDIRETYGYIEEQIDNGNLKIEDIDKKVRRIIELKNRYGLVDENTENLDIDVLNEEIS